MGMISWIPGDDVGLCRKGNSSMNRESLSTNAGWYGRSRKIMNERTSCPEDGLRPQYRYVVHEVVDE